MAKKKTITKKTTKTKKTRVKKKVPLYVFSGTAEQAEGFASEHGNARDVIVVNSKSDIPKKMVELICIGSYFNRKDRYEIFAAAQLAGAKLVDEFDWIAAQSKSKS